MDEHRRNKVLARTHDISNTKYHVGNLKDFCEILTEAVGAAFPNRGKPGYAAVHVLTLSWEDDDLGVITELLELQKVFETLFLFRTQVWKIPSDDSHILLNLRVIQFLQAFGSQENLVVIYYGGHGKMKDGGQCVFSCKSKAGSPEVLWYALQALLEIAKYYFLILLDCCFAASAAGGSGKSVKEVIAACGFEFKAPGVCEHFFTRSLIDELKYLSNNPAFWAAFLHNKVLWRMKNYNPRYARGVSGEQRRTPIYIVLANEAKKISIEFSSMVSQDPVTTDNGLQVGSSTEVSTPSGPSDDVDIKSHDSIKSSIDEIGHDAQSDFPHVLISIALDENQAFRRDEWTDWLKTLPAVANSIKIKAVYPSDSTFLLLSLPVADWDMLPENRAISFIGFVTPTDERIPYSDV